MKKSLIFKLFIYMSLLLATILSATLYMDYKKVNKILVNNEKDYLKKIENEINYLQENQLEVAKMSVLTIAKNETIKKDFYEKNRQKLAKDLIPIFEELKGSVAQIQFHLPDSTSFLRLHKLNKYGDSLKEFRFTVNEANKNKKIIQGLEYGVAGYGFRVVVPISYLNEHIGSVEYGMDFGNDFIQKIENKYKGDYYIYKIDKFSDKLLDKFLGNKTTYMNTDNKLVSLLSKKKDDLFFYDKDFIKDISLGKVKSIQSEDKKKNILYIPYKDYKGNVGGYIKAVIDRSENIRVLNNNIKDIFIMYSIGFLLILIIMYFIIKKILEPIKTMTTAAKKIAIGDIDFDIEVKTEDEIGELTKAFIEMKENIKIKSEYAKQISKGEVLFDLEIKSNKDVLGNSMKSVVNTIRNLIDEMEKMSKAHNLGEINIILDSNKFDGAYKTMAKGINKMVKDHINVKKKAMACVKEFAKGNFNADLEEFPGKKVFINESIEELRLNLKNINFEISTLVNFFKEGKLDKRADFKNFKGDWKIMINSLNGLLDTTIEPVKESLEVLKEISKGNLSKKMTGDYNGDHALIKDSLNDTIKSLSNYINDISKVLNNISKGNLNIYVDGDYKGEFKEIKTSLNNIIDSLNDVFSKMNNTSLEVYKGAKKMLESGDEIFKVSNSQSDSIDYLTNSIENVETRTLESAKDAKEANEFVKDVKIDAKKSNEKMKTMLEAMQKIKESSVNISKVIKVIEEIAFQTNILALNSAVEAARAGKYGKGFAVVSQEVRNLSLRSSKAVKESNKLIDEAVINVKQGSDIANDTANSLFGIVNDVDKVFDYISNIVKLSDEQSNEIRQINSEIQSFSNSLDSSTNIAGENVNISENLSTQSDLLKNLVDRFEIKKSM